MANESNLIPVTERSKEEARALSSKGGKASGVTRRRKKTMKDAMNLLLSLPVDDANRAKMERLGIDPSIADNQMLMLIAAFQQAIKGNVRAMEFIKEITGSSAMTELDKKQLKLENEKIALQREKLKQEAPVTDDSVQQKMDAIDGILAQMQPLKDDEE